MSKGKKQDLTPEVFMSKGKKQDLTPALNLLFLPLDDYECDVVILGGTGCVV